MYYGGSARFVATGSSFGALGGDLSTLSTNPAGLSIYRKGELSISPSMVANKYDATFNGNSTSTTPKYGFHFDNIGCAIAFADDSEYSDWKGFSIGFAYNRTNDYTSYTNIEGTNEKGSMLDYFMYNSDNTYPTDLDEYVSWPAYQTYLVDTVSSDLVYTNPLWWNLPEGEEYPQYGQLQKKTIDKRGGAGEYAFSLGANYNDLIYFGATVGIESFYYEENTKFTESDFVDSVGLQSFNYNENLRSNGSGANLKLGIILRPLDFIRIGGAIHTPTFYTITDNYSTSMNAYWDASSDDPYAYNHTSGSSNYESNQYRAVYQLTTPMRLIADVGLVIGTFALISAEYEFVDYASMRLNSSDYNFSDENTVIRDAFKSTHNLRAGAELRFGPLCLRGGYAIYDNPYKSSLGRTDAVRTQISGGLGIVTGNIYIDFAYVQSIQNDSYFLYNGYTDEPNPELNYTGGKGMVTVGVKF